MKAISLQMHNEAKAKADNSKLEGSTLVIPNCIAGHDPETIPPTSGYHNMLP
jgi:hypothetical protein